MRPGDSEREAASDVSSAPSVRCQQLTGDLEHSKEYSGQLAWPVWRQCGKYCDYHQGRGKIM